MELQKKIGIAYMLSDILNSCKIDENGIITTKNYFTAYDLELMKSYIMELQKEVVIHSKYLCETIQKTNNILRLWPYKDE